MQGLGQNALRHRRTHHDPHTKEGHLLVSEEKLRARRQVEPREMGMPRTSRHRGWGRQPAREPDGFHSGQRRNLLEQSLQIGVVHLESLRPSATTRGQQLEIILPQLKKSDHAVLMGDFNFCSSWEEENRRVDPEFHDLWPLLRQKETGYTIDTRVNRMRFQQQGKDKHARFDRIFLRSRQQAWQARDIELLGTQPLPGLPEIWPSDHLGLLAELRWTQASG